MGLFEGLQNLFRGISKGRSDDSDTLPVVSSVGLDESDGTLRFTVADGQMQVDMIWNLLTEQIGECRNQQLPKPLPNPDDLFRPTLIGAWAEDRLIGGAFVMPDSQDAQALVSLGADKAAQAFERSRCMIQGIAVIPKHRREGLGLKIKRYCDLWAAQHDACLVLSIPTNDAARHMNEKVGYDVLPPQVSLCIEVTDDDNAITCCFPVDGVVPDVCRAFHIVAQPKWMPRAVVS